MWFLCLFNSDLCLLEDFKSIFHGSQRRVLSFDKTPDDVASLVLWAFISASYNEIIYKLRQFGTKKFSKKLVISLLFCNFIVENQ